MIFLNEKYWHGFHKCRWSMIQMVGVMSLKATKTKKYQILTNFFLYFSRKKWSGQFSIFWYLGLKIYIWEWRGRSCSWEYHYYHHHHAQGQCHHLEENPHENILGSPLWECRAERRSPASDTVSDSLRIPSWLASTLSLLTASASSSSSSTTTPTSSPVKLHGELRVTQKCFPIEGPRQRIAPDRHFDETHENDHGKRDDNWSRMRKLCHQQLQCLSRVQCARLCLGKRLSSSHYFCREQFELKVSGFVESFELLCNMSVARSPLSSTLKMINNNNSERQTSVLTCNPGKCVVNVKELDKPDIKYDPQIPTLIPSMGSKLI